MARGQLDESLSIYKRVTSRLTPSGVEWQRALLGTQRALLRAGRIRESVDTGLKLLEAHQAWSGSILPATRMLATAFDLARVKLGGADTTAPAWRKRFLLVCADRNLRALHGAELLGYEGLFRDALPLLESVRDNDAASRATRSWALFRLSQFSLRLGDMATAVAAAEELAALVPSDLVLRDASVRVLETPVGSQTVRGDHAAEQRLRRLKTNLRFTLERMCPASASNRGSPHSLAFICAASAHQEVK